MQADGNLVLYNKLDQPLWSSQTDLKLTHPRLIMQDDGNLVLYNPSNQAFWRSQTHDITKTFKNQATSFCLSWFR